jgi:SAM-dependent methyltransferase
MLEVRVDSLRSSYRWPILDGSYEVVVCSSTLEHVEFPWETFREMCRVTKPGGYIYINVPSTGHIHWDWDGWRFNKDSMGALAKWGGVELIESGTDTDSGDPEWHDTWGVFRKQIQNEAILPV